MLLAFSAFVMRALDALPPAAAVAAMQQVNRFAPGPGLLVPLMGTAVLCVVLAVLAVVSLATGGSSRGWLVLVGCLLYLVAFGITAGYHVPRNDALALVDPSGAGDGGGLAGVRGTVAPAEPRPDGRGGARRGGPAGEPRPPVSRRRGDRRASPPTR